MREHIIQLGINPTDRTRNKVVRKTTKAGADEGGGKKWLKDNAVGLFGVLVVIVGFYAGYVRLEERVSALVKTADESSEQIKSVSGALIQHERDTSRHVDPVRDKELWDDLKRRLQRIEDKLDGR